ncbi:Uncharacterised protein [Mycobacteroides abscessus subsp. abscessus]|nr:Uncharacterised protein [Mycobacteroides abscessus subsp. abscessus]
MAAIRAPGSAATVPCTTPCSVTTAVTRSAGVTSKAGLNAAVPTGAVAVPANAVTSSAARSSTTMSRQLAVAGSRVDSGATTTNGIPCRCAANATA